MNPHTIEPISWTKLEAALQLKCAAHVKTAVRRMHRRGTPSRHAEVNTRITELMQRRCRDGERTEHLTHMIGVLLAHGIQPDEALRKCQEWNANNHEPLEDEKIEHTFTSILSSDQTNHPERYLEQVVHSPLFHPDEGKIDHFLPSPPPPRQWLLKELVVQGKVAAVVAPGGHSKSQWLLQVAVGVATGLPVANHWEVGAVGQALVYFAEDDKEEIHRRIYRIQHHLALQGHQQFQHTLTSNLRVHSTVGMDTLLTRTSTSGEIERTTIVDRICAEAELMADLKLIVIDPISRFRGGEENSNEDATRFVEALETIAKRTGATVMVSHHTNKGSYQADGDPSQGAARGASALTDGLRFQMDLRRPSERQLTSIGAVKQNAGRYVVATVTKTNYAAIPEPVILERLDGGYLSAVSASSAQQAQQTQAIGQVLRHIASLPRPITARQLEQQYAGTQGSLQMPVKALRTTLQSAATRGFISMENRKPIMLTDAARLLLKDSEGDNATGRDASDHRKKRPTNQ